MRQATGQSRSIAVGHHLRKQSFDIRVELAAAVALEERQARLDSHLELFLVNEAPILIAKGGQSARCRIDGGKVHELGVDRNDEADAL